MKNYLVEKNIRLRCKKNYKEAHNHVIIGRVIEETDNYLAVKGRAFHFKSIAEKSRHLIHCSETLVRIIPWENVEVIHWISAKVNWDSDIAFDEKGNLILDDKCHTIIAAQRYDDVQS
jgi:hypothetical protein